MQIKFALYYQTGIEIAFKAYDKTIPKQVELKCSENYDFIKIIILAMCLVSAYSCLIKPWVRCHLRWRDTRSPIRWVPRTSRWPSSPWTGSRRSRRRRWCSGRDDLSGLRQCTRTHPGKDCNLLEKEKETMIDWFRREQHMLIVWILMHRQRRLKDLAHSYLTQYNTHFFIQVNRK